MEYNFDAARRLTDILTKEDAIIQWRELDTCLSEMFGSRKLLVGPVIPVLHVTGRAGLIRIVGGVEMIDHDDSFGDRRLPKVWLTGGIWFVWL